jgi:predicted metal-dependent hydrolase
MKILKLQELEIEVEKKKIKNMYLKILPPNGRIHISAPINMNNDRIQSFVMEKLEWIREKQKKQQTKNNSLINQDIQYVNGDMIYYNGCKYRLSLLESAKTGVTVNQSELIMHVRKNSTIEQRRKILYTWYKEVLTVNITSLLIKWEAVIGVKSDSFTIRNMKTRWGTCNIRSKKLSFSLQLATKNLRCVEYVVVHELVHLLEGSHNHVFKAYMDKFLPDWRRIKKELNGLEPGFIEK